MILKITDRDFLDLREVYNPKSEFVIFNNRTRVVLGTTRGFDPVKSKARSIRSSEV